MTENKKHPVTGDITPDEAKELLHEATNFSSYSYPSEVEEQDRAMHYEKKRGCY